LRFSGQGISEGSPQALQLSLAASGNEGCTLGCQSGVSGVGKTGLASGLLLKALQNGYRGLFIKAQDLFDEMYASIADRASRKLIRRWARLDILLID